MGYLDSEVTLSFTVLSSYMLALPLLESKKKYLAIGLSVILSYCSTFTALCTSTIPRCGGLGRLLLLACSVIQGQA